MILVELLGADGTALSRVRLEGTWTVGTDRTCGLVLADATVQPLHVEVRENADGTALVRRLAPEGDTRVGSLVLGGEAEIALPATVHVGDVAIRLSRVPLDEASAPAPPDGASTGTPPDGADGPSSAASPPAAVRPLSRPAVAWALLATMAILFGAQELLTTYEPHPWHEMLVVVLGILLVVPLWAGAWAIGNRLFGYRHRFHDHLSAFSLWAMVALPVGVVTWGARELVYTDVTRFLGTGANLVLFSWLLYMHIRVSSRWRPRTNAVIACAVVLALGSLAFVRLDTSAEKPVKAALSTLAPLPAGLYLTSPVDDVVGRAGGIIEDLDGMKAKRSVEPVSDRP